MSTAEACERLFTLMDNQPTLVRPEPIDPLHGAPSPGEVPQSPRTGSRATSPTGANAILTERLEGHTEQDTTNQGEQRHDREPRT